MSELETKAEETELPEEGKTEESAETQEEKVVEPTEAELAEEQLKMNAHKESSRLGRRQSAMEKKMADFMEQTSEAISSLVKQSKPKVELSDDGEYMTVGDYKKLMQHQANEQTLADNEKTKADRLYGQGYESELNSIGDTADDEDIHMQVMKLVTDPKDFTYNTRSSVDPTAAAQINYNRALRDVLKKQEKGDKPKLKGDKKLPQSASATKKGDKPVKEMVFSPEAEEYMKITGTSREEAEKLTNV